MNNICVHVQELCSSHNDPRPLIIFTLDDSLTLIKSSESISTFLIIILQVEKKKAGVKASDAWYFPVITMNKNNHIMLVSLASEIDLQLDVTN